MGIFDRIKGGVKGKAESVVRGVEERNPEAVFEAAVDAGAVRLAELKDRAAGIAHQRNTEAERVEALEAEATKLADGLRAALDEDDDDSALVLQMRRTEVDEELQARRATLLTLATQAEELKAGLVSARTGIEELKRDKDRQLAQLAVAEAAIEIHETTSGMSDAPQARALDSVRESIGGLERRAHPGYLDAEGNSVRGRAEAMGRKAAEQSARSQLEALKRQRGRSHDDVDDSDESDE